jgi:hypothetical protein
LETTADRFILGYDNAQKMGVDFSLVDSYFNDYFVVFSISGDVFNDLTFDIALARLDANNLDNNFSGTSAIISVTNAT